MDKKTLIKNTAIELFKKTGQVTVREVSKACNVNVASINYYFGNKRNLMHEIEKQMVDNLQGFIVEIQSEERSLDESVALFIEKIMFFIVEAPGFFKYLINDFARHELNDLEILRTEINSGLFYNFMLDLIVKSTGLEDEDEIRNRFTIFFTSLSASAFILVNKMRFDDEEDYMVSQIADVNKYKDYMQALFRLILK
jgi:AcrR family transcriptional regulator